MFGDRVYIIVRGGGRYTFFAFFSKIKLSTPGTGTRRTLNGYGCPFQAMGKLEKVQIGERVGAKIVESEGPVRVQRTRAGPGHAVGDGHVVVVVPQPGDVGRGHRAVPRRARLQFGAFHQAVRDGHHTERAGGDGAPGTGHTAGLVFRGAVPGAGAPDQRAAAKGPARPLQRARHPQRGRGHRQAAGARPGADHIVQRAADHVREGRERANHRGRSAHGDPSDVHVGDMPGRERTEPESRVAAVGHGSQFHRSAIVKLCMIHM